VASGRDLALLCLLEIPMLCAGASLACRLSSPSSGLVLSNPRYSCSQFFAAGHRHREQEYGHLSYYHHVILGLEDVGSLVHTVTEELGTRGFTTPFHFSSLALDVNSSGVHRSSPHPRFPSYLCSIPRADANRTWHEEARFAAPAELVSVWV
jgi:hypothetical protein